MLVGFSTSLDVAVMARCDEVPLHGVMIFGLLLLPKNGSVPSSITNLLLQVSWFRLAWLEVDNDNKTLIVIPAK